MKLVTANSNSENPRTIIHSLIPNASVFKIEDKKGLYIAKSKRIKDDSTAKNKYLFANKPDSIYLHILICFQKHK